MRGPARAQGIVRRLTWLVLAALLTCAVGSVYAAKVKVSAQSSGYVRMGQNADGSTIWGTRTQWEAWFNEQMAGSAASTSRHYTTTGAVSSSTLGGFARKAIRGGVYGAAVGVAVTGIIEGAGWAINELKDQVIDPGTKEQLQGHGWCRGTQCAPTADGLIPWAQKAFPPADPSKVVRWYTTENGATGNICALHVAGGCAVIVPIVYVTRPKNGWDGYTNVAPGTDAAPVTDERLGDALRQNPQLIDDLLTDPRTGRPIMTPELQQQGQQLQQQLEQEHGLDPSDPIPAPDLNDDTANDPGSPWPSFCSWAGVVCDFIEWFKGPGHPDVELPETEIQVPTNSWSSGVGGGSCPAAQEFSITLVGTTGRGAFEFQPLCDFATTMRPILIAVCSLIAVFIVAGLRSGAGGKS